MKFMCYPFKSFCASFKEFSPKLWKNLEFSISCTSILFQFVDSRSIAARSSHNSRQRVWFDFCKIHEWNSRNSKVIYQIQSNCNFFRENIGVFNRMEMVLEERNEMGRVHQICTFLTLRLSKSWNSLVLQVSCPIHN